MNNLVKIDSFLDDKENTIAILPKVSVEVVIFYHLLIEKLSKKKNIIKIGLAFSIQEIDKVPTNMYDQKLDYIVTNKHTIK